MNKFKKRLGLAAVVSLFALAPAAHAASNTFDGTTFDAIYGYADSSLSFLVPLAEQSPTGSASSVEVANMNGWQIDTAGNSLTFSWNRGDEFMNIGAPPFTGFLISDTDNQWSDILGISVTNTTYNASAASGNLVEGFTPSQVFSDGKHVFSDGNNIYVNLSTAMWHAAPMGDPTRDTIALSVDFAPPPPIVGDTTPPIPEPETYVMLLAGLGLMGAIARRRKPA